MAKSVQARAELAETRVETSRMEMDATSRVMALAKETGRQISAIEYRLRAGSLETVTRVELDG